jgi:hypothetical protein
MHLLAPAGDVVLTFVVATSLLVAVSQNLLSCFVAI